MTPTWTNSRYARFDNGTGWPLPEPSDGNRSCAHELRYAGYTGIEDVGPVPVSTASRLHGATVIQAYEALVAMPLSQSREVLRALKAAVEMRDERAVLGDGGEVG